MTPPIEANDDDSGDSDDDDDDGGYGGDGSVVIMVGMTMERMTVMKTLIITTSC